MFRIKHSHSHVLDDDSLHGYQHGIIDPKILATERRKWAIKWLFIGLIITALLQVCIVYVSGSVALLADTIHNIGDAFTAIPLWVAFTLAR